MVSGYAETEFTIKTFPNIQILRVSIGTDMVKLLKDGSVDAYIEGDMAFDYMSNKSIVSGLKKSDWYRYFDNGKANDLYIGVRNDWSVLVGIIINEFFHSSTKTLQKSSTSR